MATVAAVVAALKEFNERNCHVVTWEALTAANAVGAVIEMGASADRTVQFSGVWNSATAVLQGSNDNVTWFTLTDPQGNAISATADKIEMISEATRYIRPSTSGGGASEDIDCIVFMKKVR